MIRQLLTLAVGFAVLAGVSSLVTADERTVPPAVGSSGVKVTGTEVAYLDSNRMVIRGKAAITGRPHTWQSFYFELTDTNGRTLRFANGQGVQKRWGSVFTPDISGTVNYNDCRIEFNLRELRNIDSLPRNATVMVYVRMIVWDPVAKVDLAHGNSHRVAVNVTTDSFGNVVRLSGMNDTRIPT